MSSDFDFRFNGSSTAGPPMFTAGQGLWRPAPPQNPPFAEKELEEQGGDDVANQKEEGPSTTTDTPSNTEHPETSSCQPVKKSRAQRRAAAIAAKNENAEPISTTGIEKGVQISIYTK